ncbi:hypothetical protein EX30DRAFT_338864 [Ascodesmis nigricans]|uniref:RING-type domain-containing protein n=1 Tax=Ascodesmis nigricans TaxID=341454 RepID=A0A4S2N545_9PEZI|nr:hypothetical protein EX30DRAFT_338864 [Ascodesmis nigricans]
MPLTLKKSKSNVETLENTSVFDNSVWSTLPPLERCFNLQWSSTHTPLASSFSSSISPGASNTTWKVPKHSTRGIDNSATSISLYSSSPTQHHHHQQQRPHNFFPLINNPVSTHGTIRRGTLTKVRCSSCHVFRGIVAMGLPCRHVLCSQCLKAKISVALTIDGGIVACCGNVVSADVAKRVMGRRKGRTYEETLTGVMNQGGAKERWRWLRSLSCGMVPVRQE